MPADRLPPNSVEMEQAVLGAMMLDKEAVIIAGEVLKARDFYKDGHQIIFEAIKELESRDEPVDLITVMESLRQKDALEKCGGVTYVASLANQVPSAAGVRHYARIVSEKSLLRQLIRICGDISNLCYEEETESSQVLAYAEQAIYSIQDRGRDQGLIHVRHVVPEIVARIETLSKHKEGLTGIPSHFKDLDRITSGWQESDLIILAARPSMGKTALGLNLAENAAVREQIPVAVFSLEMSREQLIQRLLSSRASLDQYKLRTGRLMGDEWRSLVDAAGVLISAPIYIDDTPGITVMELRSRARRLKAETGLGLVVLDYLQLMQGGGSGRGGENRQQEISEISRSLKALARELRVPVIALSQLSRAVEQTADKRPSLSHLRESGALEQDADLVMFIYREEYYDRATEKKGIAEIIIAKHRNGPVGSVELGFLEQYTKFVNLRRDVDAEER
ncbi:MAG: replicative DNA helicase [Peptococcaceae bacterium]|nr:replicative DNA helicase [Peptococcaceae bacterium]